MSPSSDAKAAKAYKSPEQNAIKGKEVLCLVNPYSGNKDAEFQYKNVALVMLQNAGASTVTKVSTTHAGHLEEVGEELAQKALLDEKIPQVVLIFGGDGSTCEFVNGVVKSATKGSMELTSPDAQRALAKVAYAVVPTGSCNGIAASFGARTTYEAIAIVIETDKGGASPFDAMQVSCVNSTEKDKPPVKLVDLHCVSWGVFADHDELAERKWRHLGKTIKALLAPIVLITQRNTYKGVIRFKPLPVSQELKDLHGYRDASKLADDENLKGYKKIDDRFIMVTLTTLPWAAFDVHLAPGTEFDDGEMALVVIRGDASRLQLIRAFLAMGNGTAAHLPFVEVYKVAALDLQTEEGFISASGRDVPHRHLKIDVVPRVCRFWKN